MLPPILKSATVPHAIEHVFERFTVGIGNWWPVDSHSVSANSGARPQAVRFEPLLEGRIYEVLPDGSRARWGEVTRWQPPDHVSFSWHPGRDPTEATQVAITLNACSDGTEILLTHEGWEALGEDAAALHAQYDPGWDFVFGQCFLAKLN